MNKPQHPDDRPGRAAPPAKDQRPEPPKPAPPAEPPAPAGDEGWEKGRPKDTGRGGA